MGHGVRKMPSKSVVIWVPGHADPHVEFEFSHGRQKFLDHMACDTCWGKCGHITVGLCSFCMMLAWTASTPE
eukprot:2883040-Amphidinium_carterae.2